LSVRCWDFFKKTNWERIWRAQNKIQFRNDATNFRPTFLRNRIRNELFTAPSQGIIRPGVGQSRFCRLMEIIGRRIGICWRSGQKKNKILGRDGPPARASTGRRSAAVPTFEKPANRYSTAALLQSQLTNFFALQTLIWFEPASKIPLEKL